MNKLFLFLFSVFILYSCNVFHHTAFNSEKTINKLNNENADIIKFDWFRGKMKVYINSDSFSGHGMVNLKIRNDSLIWGSVTAIMGFEIARFYITKNEITIIDRLHKTYFKLPINFIEQKFNITDVNYQLIQNFLTGNSLFDINNNFIQEKDMDNKDNIIFYSNNARLSRTIYIDKKTHRINRYIFKNDLLTQNVVIDFKNKIKYKKTSIPKEITINVISPQTIKIIMDYTGIQFNQPLEFNTEIPENYKKESK